MKQCLAVVTLLVLALVGPTLLLAQDRNPEQEVRVLVKQLTEADLKGDTATLDRVLDDTYTRIRSDGSVLHKAEVLEGFKSGNIKFDAFEESDVQVSLYGDTAVATSTANMKVHTLGGKQYSGQYRNVRVFVKRDGNWREVLWQSSKMGS